MINLKQKKLKFMAILGFFLVLVGLITYLPSVLNPEETKAKIITLALEQALLEQEVPDFNLIKDKKHFILSTENISTGLVPNFSKYSYVLLSPQEIQEKANREGDFLRLRFTEIQVGVFISTVSLDNSWVVSKNSKKGYLSGGGLKLTYYNIFGFWLEGLSRTMWIS